MNKVIVVTAAALLILAGCATGDESEDVEPVAEPGQTTEPVEIAETAIELGEPFTLDGPNFTAHVTIENVYIPEFCGDYSNELIAVEVDVEVESGDGTREVLNVGSVQERTPDGYIERDRVVTTSCGDIEALGAKNVQTGDKFRGAIWLNENVNHDSEILFKVPTAAQEPVAEIFVLDLSEIDLATAPETSPPSTGVVEGLTSETEAAAEPYVVECLVGTPGPSRMSDGTIRSTEYCFQEMGGPAYLEQERQSGLSGANQQPSHDGVPIADGGTCPAYLCGYGHDEHGNSNPSSGELQTQHGCEQGYITDVELCAAVGRPIQ